VAVPSTACEADADATCAAARAAETSAVEVVVDATCVARTVDRGAAASTRNAVDRAVSSGAAESAVPVPAAGEVGPAIVTPVSGAACPTGAADDGAAPSPDVTDGLGGDAVAGVGVIDCDDGVAVGVVGTGVGTGAATGGDVGGDGGRAATGSSSEVAAATGSGVATGAGAGAARGGRSPSGSTYPSSSDARRIPRWTLGSSCSGVPLRPIVPTVSPSLTAAPFATSTEPRWTRVTEKPSAVRIVTPCP
jgi:hypothetical protein